MLLKKLLRFYYPTFVISMSTLSAPLNGEHNKVQVWVCVSQGIDERQRPFYTIADPWESSNNHAFKFA